MIALHNYSRIIVIIDTDSTGLKIVVDVDLGLEGMGFGGSVGVEMVDELVVV